MVTVALWALDINTSHLCWTVDPDMVLGSNPRSDVTMVPVDSAGHLDRHEPNCSVVLEPLHGPRCESRSQGIRIAFNGYRSLWYKFFSLVLCTIISVSRLLTSVLNLQLISVYCCWGCLVWVVYIIACYFLLFHISVRALMVYSIEHGGFFHNSSLFFYSFHESLFSVLLFLPPLCLGFLSL